MQITLLGRPGCFNLVASSETRDLSKSIVIYLSLILAFTAVSLAVAPASSKSGTFRAIALIPGHEAELAAFAIALAVLPSLVLGRVSISLFLLIPVVCITTDLDHLPSALGIPQAIRPAHSFVFLLVSVGLVLLLTRRTDLGAGVLTGFLGHLSVDTGLFPAFSPFSFAYFDLGSYRGYFVTGSILASLLAGYLVRRRLRSEGARTQSRNAPSGELRRIQYALRPRLRGTGGDGHGTSAACNRE